MLRSLSVPIVRLRGRPLLQAILAIAGAALIALSERLAIALPFSPVPITGQTLAVLALAGSLGRRSVVSVLLYLLGSGALVRLVGPTGGYLLGFVLAAYGAGWLAERSGGRWYALLGALLVGQAAIYACGLAGLSRFLPPERLLLAGVYPFLVGDAYKLAVATVIARQARKALPQA